MEHQRNDVDLPWASESMAMLILTVAVGQGTIC